MGALYVEGKLSKFGTVIGALFKCHIQLFLDYSLKSGLCAVQKKHREMKRP